jgi:UDP-N-acetyl-2-amino-2-deoxyglucuronate dehydrogenase
MMDTPAPFDLAVVGVGMGSAPHLRSLADLHADYPLAWVCARDAQRLAALALPDGVRRTTHLDDILQDPRVRAVLVLTPASSHLELVRRVAAAGKHVLVEKPLDLDLARARELVACCEAAGVKLAVMLQYRMRDASRRLAELLHSGALGSLTSAAAHVRWWRPQSYYDEPGRGTLARDGGGVLMTQAIHTLDLLLHLIGPPQGVTGTVSTSTVHRMECEDSASALLHYPGGVVALVQATTAAYPGYPERIEINASLGTATLEAGRLQVAYADGRTETLAADTGSGGGADPMAFDHGPHRAVIRDWLDAVQTGRAPAVTGRSALLVHAVIEAIIASSTCGAQVALAGDIA